MSQFDKEKQKRSMLPAISRLVGYFVKKGYEFYTKDGELENVVFTKGEKVVKISHHSFYRYSGIAFITRGKTSQSSEVEIIPVTDEMYMQTIILPIVETLFEKQ